MSLGLGVSALFRLTDEQRKDAVWNKGHIIAGHPVNVWRRDDFGNVIRYADYGDRNSLYGWEVDHIVPTGLGGPDDISNLRPLHHTRNASLGGALASLLKG